MSVLACPVCKQPLEKNNNAYCCKNNHSYDIAKEGYINLLSAHKNGDNIGDNKEMARSRRDFLSKGYYASLAKALGDCLEKYTNTKSQVLDICCGEGYYTSYLANMYERNYYGFDISKNMVKLGAKRKCFKSIFVANIADIPIADNSIDFAFHLFAPFHSKEFSRILKKDGVLLSVIPGKNHLLGIKEVLYDTPYQNDEQPPKAEEFSIIDTIHVKTEITLNSPQDIMALFQMTPYYYHTPSKGMAKLESLSALSTPIEFVILIYEKK